MARVAALYRYPVKGFTPEVCSTLQVQEDGRIAGDRVLGFRFASTPQPDDDWSSKHGMVVLVNTPGLARLETRFDETRQRLSLSIDGSVLVEDELTPEGRARICSALEGYVLSLPVNPLSNRPDHLPLRLIGNGKESRYQDSDSGRVSLHGRASLTSLGEAFGDSELSEIRFRSNIAIDGIEPWEEMSWAGRRLKIGDVEFEVYRPMVRCLATHANPESGERDREMLQTLPRVYGGGDPVFAVSLETVTPGTIRLDDEVEVL